MRPGAGPSNPILRGLAQRQTNPKSL